MVSVMSALFAGLIPYIARVAYGAVLTTKICSLWRPPAVAVPKGGISFFMKFCPTSCHR